MKKFWKFLSYVLLFFAIISTIKVALSGNIGMTIKGIIYTSFAISLVLMNTLKNKSKSVEIILFASCGILFLSDIIYLFSGFNLFN